MQWELWADVLSLILVLQIYQSWLDKSTPYTAVRWVVTLGLSFVYMIRVYLLQVSVVSTVCTLSNCAIGWGMDWMYIRGVVCNNYFQKFQGKHLSKEDWSQSVLTLSYPLSRVPSMPRLALP